MNIEMLTENIEKLKEDLRVAEGLLNKNKVDDYELISEISRIKHQLKCIEIFDSGL